MDDLKIDKDKINGIVAALELLAEQLNDAKVGQLESTTGGMDDYFQAAREEAKKRDQILDFIKYMSENVADHVIKEQSEQLDHVENDDGVYTVADESPRGESSDNITAESHDPLRLETKTPSNITTDLVVQDTPEPSESSQDQVRVESNDEPIISDTLEVTVTDINEDTLERMSVSIAKALTRAELEMGRRRRRGFGTGYGSASGSGEVSDSGLLSGLSSILPWSGLAAAGGAGALSRLGGRLVTPKGTGLVGGLFALVDAYDVFSDDSLTDQEKISGYAGAAGLFTGTIAGGKIGAIIGSILGPPGVAIGGIIGAIGGGVFGEKAAESLADYIQDPKGLSADVDTVSTKIMDLVQGVDTKETENVKEKAKDKALQEMSKYQETNPNVSDLLTGEQFKMLSEAEQQDFKSDIEYTKSRAVELGVEDQLTTIKKQSNLLKTKMAINKQSVADVRDRIETDYERLGTYMFNMVLTPEDDDRFDDDKWVYDPDRRAVTKDQLVGEMKQDIQRFVEAGEPDKGTRRNATKNYENKKQLYDTFMRLKEEDETAEQFAERVSKMLGNKLKDDYVTSFKVEGVDWDEIEEVQKAFDRKIEQGLEFDEKFAEKGFQARFDLGVENIGDELRVNIPDIDKLGAQFHAGDESAVARVEKIFVEMDRMKETAATADDVLTRARYKGFTQSELGKYLLTMQDYDRRKKANPDAFKPLTSDQHLKLINASAKQLLKDFEQADVITKEDTLEIRKLVNEGDKIKGRDNTVDIDKYQGLNKLREMVYKIDEDENKKIITKPADPYKPYPLFPTPNNRLTTPDYSTPTNRIFPAQQEPLTPRLDPRVEQIKQQILEKRESEINSPRIDTRVDQQTLNNTSRLSEELSLDLQPSGEVMQVVDNDPSVADFFTTPAPSTDQKLKATDTPPNAKMQTKPQIQPTRPNPVKVDVVPENTEMEILPLQLWLDQPNPEKGQNQDKNSTSINFDDKNIVDAINGLAPLLAKIEATYTPTTNSPNTTVVNNSSSPVNYVTKYGDHQDFRSRVNASY